MRIFPLLIALFAAAVASAQVKLPKSPNQLDENKKRTGFWTILYDTAWKQVQEEKEAAYYRIILFEAGKPVGKVRDFYTSYQKQWDGYLSSFDPEIKEGEAISYYENGRVESKAFYKQNKMNGPYFYFSKSGVLTSEGTMLNDSSTGVWKHYREEDGSLYLECETKGSFIHGKATWYHPNGKMASTGIQQWNKREGLWKFYYEDGKTKTISTYKNDLNNGPWALYNEDGIQVEKGAHLDDEATGIWEYYFDNGKLKSTGHFRKGKKEGHWKYYYDNGQLKSEGDNIDGKESGTWVYYHKNGKVQAKGELLEDLYQGQWSFYFDNGQLERAGNYTKDSLDGHWNYYYDNGKLKTDANYIDNKRNGEWKYFTTEGIADGIENYKMGKLFGEALLHHADGSVQAIKRYKNDTLQGNYVAFHANSKKASEGKYDNGNFSGPWKWYYDNGQLSQDYTYINGRYNGPFVEYFANGKLKKKGTGKDGQGIGEELNYFENGNIKSKGFMANGNREGEWTYYDSLTGKVNSTGRYVHNLLDGQWKFYTPEGKPDGISYYINGFFENVANVKDSINQLIEQKKFELAHQHISWLKKVIKRDAENKKTFLEPIYLMAQINYSEGKKEEALKGYKEYAEKVRKLEGDSSYDYHITLNSIANCLADMKKRNEAMAIYDQIIGLVSKTGSAYDISTIISNKALTLGSLNKTEEGEQLLLQRKEELQKRFGAESKEVIYVLQLAASFYHENAMYKQAITVYHDLLTRIHDNKPLVLEIKRKLGKEYKNYNQRSESIAQLKEVSQLANELKQLNEASLEDIRSIGDSYLYLRQLDSAKMYFDAVLALIPAAGLENTYTHAMALDGLAKVAYYNYDNTLCITLWLSVKTLFEKLGRKNTIEYANLLQGLAFTIQSTDPSRFDEAEKLFISQTEIKKELYGPYAETYLAARSSLAAFYKNQSKYTAALSIIDDVEKSIEFNTSLPPSFHASVLCEKGLIQFNLIQYKEAITLYQKAIALFESDESSDFQEEYVLAYKYLAQCYRNMGKYDEAVINIKEAMRLQKEHTGENTIDYLDYLTTLTFILTDQGLYSDAEKTQAECMKNYERLVGKENVLYAYAIRNMGYVMLKRGDYLKAKSFYNTYLDLAERLLGRSSSEYLGACSRLAEVESHLIDADDPAQVLRAEKLYQREVAVAFSIYGKDHIEYAYALKDLALFYYDFSRAGKAEKAMIESAAIAATYAGVNSRFYAVFSRSLAKIYAARDKNREAEESYKNTIAIYANADGINSWPYLNAYEELANFYSTLGQFPEAEKCFALLSTLIEKNYGQTYSYATNLINNGFNYYQWGKAEKATVAAEKALAILENEVQPDHYQILEARNLLGLVSLDLLKLEEAKAHFNFIIAENTRNGKTNTETHVAVLYNLAAVYAEQNDFTRAEKIYNEANIIQASIYEKGREQSAVFIDNLAALYQAWGKYEQAEKYWLKATQQILKEIQNNFYFMSDQEKTLFWNKNRKDFEAFNTFSLKRRQSNPAIIGDMYNHQLKTKAILLSSSNKIRKRIWTSRDTTLINNYRSWIEGKELLSKYYSYSGAELKERKIPIDSIEKAVITLEKEINITTSDLDKDKGWSAITWRDIQKTLGPSEAAVEIIRFRYFDRHFRDSIIYVALILTAETKINPKVVVLNDGKQMEGRGFNYYKNMIALRQPDTRTYDLYWSSIDAALVNKQRLYLSLDGIYNQISLNTLQKEDGSFLVDHKNITLVSNTKDVLLIKNRPPKKTGTSIATLIGYPKFFIGAQKQNEGVSDSTRAIDLEDHTGIAELPGTKTEIRQVEQILTSHQWKTTEFTGEKATEESIKEISNPKVLHIATHGFFIDDTGSGNSAMGVNTDFARQNPLLRSGLLFSGASDFIQNNISTTAENGILHAYEAANLSLDNTELVVLSACETGKGEVQNGEGVYGLQRAFQTAGAKAVIMSLWKVDDTATQQLMSSFYENWMNGKEKSEAFKSAQLELKKKYPEPYYWGAFVMTGQ